MKSQAVFFSASVDWKRKIFLDVTGRNEWTSLLANTKNKSFFYPSVGMSFVLTEFFKSAGENIDVLQASSVVC